MGNRAWSKVIRKAGRNPPQRSSRQSNKKEQIALLRRRAPWTSTVTIDRSAEEGVTLTSVMKMVARSVDLKKIGVKVRNTR